METAPNVRYSCTALLGTNKAGELKCDSHGYYEVVLSALDYPNTFGARYRTESAKRMLDASSILMRKIADGNLYGENGHPRFEQGMSQDEFSMRMYDIAEPRVSHHISDVWLDCTGALKDYEGKPFNGIIGLVKPDGEMGSLLKSSFENPRQNTCFSVRSVTDNFLTPRGTIEKDFVTIMTWDWITAPGLRPSSKFCSPGLESMFGLNEMLDMPVSIASLERAVRDVKAGRISVEDGRFADIVNTISAAKRLTESKNGKSDAKWLNW